MYLSKRVIAIVPARGGSKGIPKKNIRFMAGKPLITWTIELACEVQEIDRIIVSTDCEEIANISRESGAEVYMRPSYLSKDDSLVIDTVIHLKNILKAEGETAEVYLLLEPTAPLRIKKDITDCLELLLSDGDYDSVATFEEANLNPHRAWKIEENIPRVFIEGSKPWLPRQRLPQAYQGNGYVYAFKSAKLNPNNNSFLFGNYAATITAKERAYGDIDTELDFLFNELIMRRKIEKN